MLNSIYHSLKVIALEGKNGGNLRCQCECGKIVTRTRFKVINGHTKSCGCKKYQGIDLGGKTIGEWTVLNLCSQRPRRWLCRCSCGVEKPVAAANLLSGHSRTCGCKQVQVLKENALRSRRGESAGLRRLFNSYRSNAKQHHRAFALTFDEFQQIVKSPCRYCGEHTTRTYFKGHYSVEYVANGVDRINNDVGYEPGNVHACCGWCNRAKYDLSEAEFIERIRKCYAVSKRTPGL